MKPVFDGFMLHSGMFLWDGDICCMTPHQVGLLMRKLRRACEVGDVATLRRYPFVGRLLRKSRPRSRVSKLLKRRVFERDGNRCLHCGSEWFLEADHIKPVVFGGTDDYDNLQTLCRTCNKAKGPSAYALRRLEENA